MFSDLLLEKKQFGCFPEHLWLRQTSYECECEAVDKNILQITHEQQKRVCFMRETSQVLSWTDLLLL